jgi:Ca2+-binding RTX toxin-like protein
MYGYGGADVFHGGDGVDTIYGGDGNDVLYGDAGNDNLYGDAGNDTLHGGAGNDALRGGAGDDTYVFDRNFSGTTAGDIIYENASDGFDTIRFTDGIEAEEVFSWTDSSGYLWMQVGNTAATNTLKAQGSYSSTTGVATRIEQVVFDDATVWDLTQGLHLRNTDTARTFYGSAYGDILEGGSAAETIYGYGGNDTLVGNGGNDNLRGGDGNDTYLFGYGFSLNATGDRIIETATGGTDTIRFTDSIAPTEVYSWTDTSGFLWFQLGTNAASNTLKADGAYSASTGITAYVEQVAFDDTTVWDLTQGLHLRNNDTGRQMYGSALGDWIEGGAGADTLRGFGGDDILIGRSGNDGLYGGAGEDTFVFLASDVGNGIDTLYDFSVADDVIDLRDVLDSGYDPINDVLSDFVRFTNSGSNSKLEVDMDGAGTTYGWTQIATVNGHINLDAVTLETNGHLLAA